MTQASENNVISEDVSKLESATDNVDHSQSGHDNNVEEDLGENKDENKTGKNSQAEEGTDESLASPPPKNTRMKGYLVIGIVSIVNYAAADVKEDGKLNAVFNVRDKTQRGLVLVMVASMLSLVLCSFMVLIGLDRFTRLQRYWKRVSSCMLLRIYLHPLLLRRILTRPMMTVSLYRFFDREVKSSCAFSFSS
mmetsp:Transcript_36029/g.44058  ORF Transcript_36029/g.44058 Transcript_36029/m.44058 type:complete len:193 (-) Transcript_36029:822-1400(-)